MNAFRRALFAATTASISHRRAIFSDTSVASLGRITLKDLTATGQVQILAREAVRGGHVEVDGLDIVAADVRRQSDRPPTS